MKESRLIMDYSKVLSRKAVEMKPSGIRKFFDMLGTCIHGFFSVIFRRLFTFSYIQCFLTTFLFGSQGIRSGNSEIIDPFYNQ